MVFLEAAHRVVGVFGRLHGETVLLEEVGQEHQFRLGVVDDEDFSNGHYCTSC
ncbi:hypothetical protein D3C84_1229330 [compost metagenome]